MGGCHGDRLWMWTLGRGSRAEGGSGLAPGAGGRHPQLRQKFRGAEMVRPSALGSRCLHLSWGTTQPGSRPGSPQVQAWRRGHGDFPQS